MGVRKQFYETLRTEFKDGKDTSFLCRYLKQERESHPREDDYARLERCYAHLVNGGASQRDYLILALEVLLKNSRLSLTKGGEILLGYGRALGGEDFFRGKRRDSEKYAALLAALEVGEPAVSLPPHAVRTLHRELLSAFLYRDAQTYLYDVGRKRDRDMAMLDAYCADKDLVLAPGGGDRGSAPLGRQELEQWEALLEALRRERRRKVLIPIRVDPWTGAGLFIVDRTHCPMELRGEGENCYYAYFYLDGLTAEDEEGASLVYRFFPEEQEEMSPFPSLEEAQHWYAQMLKREAKGFYQGHNGPAPKGCPEELLRYFESGKETAKDPEKKKELADKGKRAFLEDDDV